MCSCGCQTKQAEKPAEDKTYVCIQCNTFKTTGAGEKAPECCGKKMNEMD